MVYIIYTSRIASKVSKVIKFWRGNEGILQDDPNANWWNPKEPIWDLNSYEKF
jgi:hypothetical protein